MSVLRAELKMYKPATIDATGSNGGLMTAVEVSSGVANNMFPNVPQAERLAGSTLYRKFFYKIGNDDDITLNNGKLYLNINTPGDDRITFFQGTVNDIQSAVSGDGINDSKTHYGCGQLNADVVATDTQITVLVEDNTDDTIFRNGDKIRISDMGGIDGAGNEEYHEISNVGFVANVATIDLVGSLANGFTAANTKVHSILEYGDVETTHDTFNVTSASGTYDDTTYPPILDFIGTVEDQWTLTFTSGTAYDIVGANSGAVGSGNISGGAAPINSDFSKPYWTLDSAGFGGTWLAAETITFNTHPAVIPFWLKRRIPAGAASISGNNFRIVIEGESA